MCRGSAREKQLCGFGVPEKRREVQGSPAVAAPTVDLFRVAIQRARERGDLAQRARLVEVRLGVSAQEIGDLPAALLERIEHYFSTYKLVPDEPPKIHVTGRYGYAAAAAVIRAAIEDYAETFARIER